MRWTDSLRLLLRSLLRRRVVERELDAEVQSYLDEIIARNLAAGMNLQEATTAARRAFGSLARIKEGSRDAWRVNGLDELWRDLRIAIRGFVKSPGFTVVAVATLALSMGATTAVFTPINAIFLKPLPVREAGRLQALSYLDPARADRPPSLAISHADYSNLRERSTTFADLACWLTWPSRPLGERGPINVQFVSGNYFRTLGVTAVLGRTLVPDDDRPGAPLTAVLSHRMWRRELGGDAGVLTKTIRIQGRPFQIVGVMPAGFSGLEPTAPHDLMVAHAAGNLVIAATDGGPRRFCQTFGRLKNGVSSEQARVEAEILFRQAAGAPGGPDRRAVRVLLSDVAPGGGPSGLRERTRLSLALLIAAAVVTLLVASVNLGGLLLVRARAREREIGTRLAVGATRGRIARQLLTESALLSLVGGVLGVGLAYSLSPLLPGAIQELDGAATLTGESLPLGVDMAPDVRVLGFSVSLIVLTVIVFGVAPAIRGSRVDVLSMLRLGSPATRRMRGERGGRTLLALQVALSMLLLIVAGLFARTFDNLNAVAVGYQPEGLLFATLNPLNRPRAFVDDALRRLEAIPGVTAVSASQFPLFNNAGLKLPFCVPGRDPLEHAVDLETVLPRFFETWGVPFQQGADLRAGEAGQAVVNRTLADRFFAGQPAVGQTIGAGRCPGRPLTIVGVVADHLDRQREPITPMVYVRYPPDRASNPTTVAIRTTADSRVVMAAFRRVILQLDTSLMDGDVTSGVEYRNSKLRREAILTSLLGAFGALALLMSCLGIYGTVAYAVSRRTREIGVRAALGAQKAQVIRTVLAGPVTSVAVGTVAGTAAAVTLSTWIERLLFRVSRIDGWTLAGAGLVLITAAALAAARPALRAVRISPVEALRCE